MANFFTTTPSVVCPVSTWYILISILMVVALVALLLVCSSALAA
jgi:hypothetical protein